MKAKIKGTGEIVDVRPNGEIMIHNRCTKFVTKDGRVFLISELDLPAIDWEQRRYEIAKDVLANIPANYPESLETKVSVAVMRADALIKELKKRDEK